MAKERKWHEVASVIHTTAGCPQQQTKTQGLFEIVHCLFATCGRSKRQVDVLNQKSLAALWCRDQPLSRWESVGSHRRLSVWNPSGGGGRQEAAVPTAAAGTMACFGSLLLLQRRGLLSERERWAADKTAAERRRRGGGRGLEGVAAYEGDK